MFIVDFGLLLSPAPGSVVPSEDNDCKFLGRELDSEDKAGILAGVAPFVRWDDRVWRRDMNGDDFTYTVLRVILLVLGSCGGLLSIASRTSAEISPVVLLLANEGSRSSERTASIVRDSGLYNGPIFAAFSAGGSSIGRGSWSRLSGRENFALWSTTFDWI